jgi:hypothetical protein
MGNFRSRPSTSNDESKIMNMKITNTLSIIAAAIALTISACSTPHTHEESSEKSEAIAIHDQCKIDANEFHKKLANQFAHTPQTDTSFIYLIELDARFVTWKKTLVKLPGTQCDHPPGEDHVHDHEAESALEKLSDLELLELQKAIREELDKMACDLNTLLGEPC